MRLYSFFHRYRTLWQQIRSPLPTKGPVIEETGLDICHVGVLLRTVLAIHLAIGLVVSFLPPTGFDTVILFGTTSMVFLPAVLLWILIACKSQAWLKKAAAPIPTITLVGLGAMCPVLVGWPLCFILPDIFSWARPWPLMASGSIGAASLIYWLKLRARSSMPAAATARLAELQARIRPHFLFNTLNTAVALVRVDPKRAETILEDLAELFRSALADAQAQVSLGEEIELAQRYLDIEQIRFGTRLRLQWELDPRVHTARVPPLLLQPLVENAVKHGIEPSPKGGLIKIKTKLHKGQALLIVSNTMAAVSNPGHGMALANVQERLTLMHDVSARLDRIIRGSTHHIRIQLPLP